MAVPDGHRTRTADSNRWVGSHGATSAYRAVHGDACGRAPRSVDRSRCGNHVARTGAGAVGSDPNSDRVPGGVDSNVRWRQAPAERSGRTPAPARTPNCGSSDRAGAVAFQPGRNTFPVVAEPE